MRSKKLSIHAAGRIAAFGTLILLAGCASINPKPWEKDLMARKEMLVTAQSAQQAAEDHIYFSKEASSGGRSAAGGGCGCN